MTQIPPTTPVKKWTFETAIEQLELCDYEAEGGKLIWNDAFIWLKNCALAEKDEQVAALERELDRARRRPLEWVEAKNEQM